MDILTIHNATKKIEADNFNLENSRFINGCMSNSHLENMMMAGTTILNVNASNMKITNANLSDLEIEGAQLGGAYIHNIGMPPKDHPMHVQGVTMRPVRFEDCELH